MARSFIYFLLMQCFVLEVLSSYPQPTVQQYLQLMGLPQPHTIAVPAPHPAPASQPCPPSQPRPPPASQTLAALALPNLVSRLQQMPPLPPPTNQPRPVSTPPPLTALGLPNLVGPKTESSCVDGKLLNNLAVALQLLIVSNILNSPPPKESLLAKSASENSPYAPPCSVPTLSNSNFIGGSNYPEQSLSKSYKPTRNGLALMSPYEALAPAKSYTDSYSFGSRQDFQSPYAAFADQDLFSMNDLF